MRILGLDPSLCKTGWGIIDNINDTFIHISHGVIVPKISLPTEQRLAFLTLELQLILDSYKPEIVAIEDTYCGINPSTSIRLGFASGALMATCGLAGLSVRQYATRLVKQMVTKKGSSDKILTQECVMDLLNIKEKLKLDSSDALAVAIAHVILNPPQQAVVKPVLDLNMYKTSQSKEL